ncbi:MAG: hypothetical protein GX597_06500 [Anaerolineaceae bacterium]|nr:hypothetical protein [Anaerolineaceae bacterium]
MKPGILLTRIWSDDDVIELRIDVSDGVAFFSNSTYVVYSTLTETIADLNRFKDQIYSGLLDVRFGEFGPEYAGGAFHARFHFAKPGRLFVTCKQQSDFQDFSIKKVASEATLYLKSEPVLLDRFLASIGALMTEHGATAYLEAV